ncbi:MAG TPA: hypothetical protein VFW94_10980 [Candidatus Acidoferrales bacterium]|nr:hypothetical protein [Candidatus Acidoferrales bacterium]
MPRFAVFIALSLFGAFSAAAQGPQGVYAPNQRSEVALTYTFVRFYEVPHTLPNENGFTLSGAYYPREWVGADLELTGAFGNQNDEASQLFFFGAGPRLRWPASDMIQLWVHGLIGDAHFTPKTPYGSESAFAYKGGGGIDLAFRHSRIAYRIAADVVGTRFFGTYQYSPQVSAGIVFKF